MSVKPFFDLARASLSSIYAVSEAQEISFLLLNFLTGFSKTDILSEKSFLAFNEIEFNDLVSRLLKHEPIQYVIGKAVFFGRDFLVTKNTLIPRPETEELVAIIIKENSLKSNLKILDIGTGTGCIPISLCLQMSDNEYFAIDISNDALAVAKQNAFALNANIHLISADILQIQKLTEEKFDIIVSNPPYVLESDKVEMDANVLDFEPEMALFVPDQNALLYYDAILRFSMHNLKVGGKVYFEIHEKKGQEMQQLMKKYHFYDTEIKNDFNNKARFAIATFTPQ
ncbi:MAG: peptide chain release factor N(5)-glutamine methyltransferase [Cytophagales bacterium]